MQENRGVLKVVEWNEREVQEQYVTQMEMQELKEVIDKYKDTQTIVLVESSQPTVYEMGVLATAVTAGIIAFSAFIYIITRR